MSKKEIAIFIILFIILAIGKAWAMNIGASQPGGTNIGVGQYEAAASANTTNFFQFFN